MGYRGAHHALARRLGQSIDRRHLLIVGEVIVALRLLLRGGRTRVRALELLAHDRRCICEGDGSVSGLSSGSGSG